MDRPVRKRSPLGAISPSTKKKGNKRRFSNLDDANIKNNVGNSSQSGVGSQNMNPNISNETPTTTGTCRRPLLDINRNIPNICGTPKSGYDGNCKNSTTGSTHNSGAALKNDSPQHMVAPSLRRINNLSFSGAGCPNGGTQKVTTPSQRRLNNVDLSGITYQSPVSRILQGGSTMRNPHTPFQLPASRISPTKTNPTTFHSKVDKRLLESYNRDRFSQHMSPSMLHIKELGIKSNNMDFGKSASKAPIGNKIQQHDLPVFVPRLEELNVRCPDWISSHSGYQDDNWQTSTPPEVRNLMDSFNAAQNELEGIQEQHHETSTYGVKISASNNKNQETIPEVDIDEGDAVNIDEHIDDDDELDGHRGEYLSDDESESNVSEADLWSGYMSLGKPDKICQKCKARMWNEERNNKSVKHQQPTFSLCCRDGRVQLPGDRPPPPFLADLLSGGEKTSHFMKNIRTYNSMFAFTSMGGKIDKKINNGNGPWCFKLNGQNYHLIGTLKPKEGNPPRFCQLYVYDTENEIENRINAIPGGDQIDPDIVEGLLNMLDENNNLVQQFRMARDRFKLNEQEEFKLVLVSSKSASGRPNHVGPSNEVAGLIVGDAEDTSKFKDIIVKTKQGYLKRIYETYVHYMQLQYPLLFPYGEDGFHLDIPLRSNPRSAKNNMETDEGDGERKSRDTLSMREYYAYKLMIRPDQGMTLHLGGRLWQQFVVDAFAAVEQYRLNWIRGHQKIIRSDLYRSIRDSIRKGDTNPDHLGQKVILPATFTGSPRYMNQYFKDSLAICRTIGHPSLFLTMTCNTKWPEIEHMLSYMPGVDVSDVPDVIARVFKLKLDQLLDLIKNKNYFGRCIGVMHVIEFQKRGLPHTHMLIWLHPNDRPKNVEQIDQLISAEIPDRRTDPVGYEVVKNFMIHGPCGSDYKNSPCMLKNKCMRHFPKRYNGRTCFDDCGFPLYRRRRMDRAVKKKGIILDNRFVVPYNRDLLIRFHCHINLEVCNSSRSLKYLFKYCLKGHDTATMILKRKNEESRTQASTSKRGSLDEIKHYLDGRYVCAVEAAWRLFGFDIHYRYPSVERLPVHIPGEKNVCFKTSDDLEQVVDLAKNRRSKLEAWFVANKTFPHAREFTYAEFPKAFTWKADATMWKQRQRGSVIGRLSDVHASSGDTFYLRMLLMRQKGATSYKDLRTINGHLYSTFKEACQALGLLRNDNQWHEAMSENSVTSMPRQLRALFMHILTNCPVSDPLRLWKEHWASMSEDILYSKRKESGNSNLQLSEFEIENYTLAEVEKLLNDVGKSLKDYQTMPYPQESFLRNSVNRLILEETGYDKKEMKEQHNKFFSQLNLEQMNVYNSIMDSVENEKGGLFFVYGSGGCGKTFLWKTLCCRLRGEGKIILPVASSGIAATLLPGGRTAHSRFHIPLKLDQYSVAGIKHGSDIAELMKQTSLIIWDEAPMQHRHGFECVDRSLRDIMSSVEATRAGRPFGGITVVFGGDFRQILPVIPKGTRPEIVSASLNRSRLWDQCKVFLLEQNMRLSSGKTERENAEIANFSQWVLDVGDGKLPNIHPDDLISDPEVVIPDKFLLRGASSSIKDIVNVTYPDFINNRHSATYLKQRSILTPTNAVVHDINSYVLDMIPGKTHTYLSQDSIDDHVNSEDDYESSFPVEYLNSINMPCLPKHELNIKVGAVVMLMRNLNQIIGLCNGTRLIVKKCLKNSILCEILCGTDVGTTHIIPRIEMEPTDTRWPFTFKRIQFPLQLCFAMTVNKSQGQSLDKVGLYLPSPVFTHGQYYVAVSRVTSPSGLHILIPSDTGYPTNVTANVVYEEVFYNLPKSGKD